MFEQYIVIADYKKKNKNDISLTAGDTVDVIENSDFGKEYLSETRFSANFVYFLNVSQLTLNLTVTAF